MTIRTTTKSIANKNKWKQKKTRVFHAYCFQSRHGVSQLLRINRPEYMCGFTILVPGLGEYIEHPKPFNDPGNVRYYSFSPKLPKERHRVINYDKLNTYAKQFVSMPYHHNSNDSIHVASSLFEELVYQYDEFEYSRTTAHSIFPNREMK